MKSRAGDIKVVNADRMASISEYVTYKFLDVSKKTRLSFTCNLDI